MFPRKIRLSGMEFAACERCNFATRAADTLASFVARISPTSIIDELEISEARKLLGTLTQISPDCVRELFDQQKSQRVWQRGRDPIFGPKLQIVMDGPATTAMMRAFAAKMGMALYREHVGEALPVDGFVFTQHYFNQGLLRREAELLTSIMPAFGELKQGKISSGRVFNYRYNTDLKTIVAALIAFNDNFFVRAFATADPLLIEALASNHHLPPVGVGDLPKLASTWSPTSVAPV